MAVHDGNIEALALAGEERRKKQKEKKKRNKNYPRYFKRIDFLKS